MMTLPFIFPLFAAIHIPLTCSTRSNTSVDCAFAVGSGNLFSWIVAMLLAVQFSSGSSPDEIIYVYRFFTWSTLGAVDLGYSIWIDYISAIMCATVLTVSVCVQCFSVYYMRQDPQITRFFVYLSLFTFCMLILVVAEDLLQFFIGWEAVGLCSYILINFWYSRLQANKAAMKAIFINRIGDFGFFVAMCQCFVDYQTLSIAELAYLASVLDVYTIMILPSDVLGGLYVSNTELICFFFFIGVMSKSAQFGLHSWLPDAMEGPTPVSALIHAATMVTAGVFLMLRMAPLFILAPRMLTIICYVGSTTMLFGATTALAQTDIKKTIAFSTCSQLGYMVAACGLGHFNVAFFHLVTHAYFKALLFLCAGVLIHSSNGQQDIRRLSGLRNVLPLVYVAMVISSFALMGIPFLSGFYSKELIIGLAWLTPTDAGGLTGLFAIVSAWFTSAYSVKLLLLAFWGVPRAHRTGAIGTHSSAELYWVIPLVVLSFFSIAVGFFLKETLAAPGAALFPGPMSQFITDVPNTLLRVEWVPMWFKWVTLTAGAIGFLWVWSVLVEFRSISISPSMRYQALYRFFYYRWCLDVIFYFYFVCTYYRALHFFIFLTVQQRFVDRLTLDIYIEDTENGSCLVIASSGRDPMDYLREFSSSLVFYILLYYFILGPETDFNLLYGPTHEFYLKVLDFIIVKE